MSCQLVNTRTFAITIRLYAYLSFLSPALISLFVYISLLSLAFFSPSVLNSTKELSSFVANLPPLPNDAVTASVYDVCDAVDSADACFRQLPADARSQILLAGEFLAGEGKLADIGVECAEKVAPVLLRSPVPESADRLVYDCCCHSV